MGNRAVIEFAGEETGIYLHWNGGPESVGSFLGFARAVGVGGSGDYAIARCSQIIGNFFGGTLSVGTSTLARLDRNNGDNGTYVVNNQLEIVGARHMRPQVPAGFDRVYAEQVFEAVVAANLMFRPKEHPADSDWSVEFPAEWVQEQVARLRELTARPVATL